MKNNKSILKEALADYDSLKEASDKNAKNKLAEEFSGRFNELIKEEITKNKKSAKESEESDNAEKIEESVNSDNDKTKNSVMKKETKGSKNVDKEIINENVYETETTDNGDYAVDPEQNDPYMTVEDIERELSSFDGDETGDETGVGSGDVGDEIGGAVGDEVGGDEVGGDGGENIEQELKELRDKLDVIIASLDSDDNADGNIEDLGIDGADGASADGEDSFSLPSDDEIDEILNFGNEPEVDEAHGLSYTSRRNMIGREGGLDYAHLSTAEQDQSPDYIKESKTKIDALIKENKHLTQKLNETKKLSESATVLIDQYKTALSKYREQLKEMAVFNTNLAHVNNILINEELALTQQDKIKIINEFKNISDITESQKKYTSVIAEMKNPKKPISESFEDKLSASINPSSKQKLDEVIERTSYTNDDHLAKILKNIEYAENRKR